MLEWSVTQDARLGVLKPKLWNNRGGPKPAKPQVTVLEVGATHVP